jgi:hypothetical protein
MKLHFRLFGFFVGFFALAASAGWNNGEWRDFLTASAQGANVSAKVITKDASSTAGNYSKIVILTEGFDASDGASKEFTLDSLEHYLKNMRDSRSMSVYANLFNENYTMVLIDFDNNWADLKKQGYALGNLMQQLWDKSRKVEPIKVIGLSMGGIIGSFACKVKDFYALNPTYAKESWEPGIYGSWNFKVNLMLTVDAPHSGAFIPESIYFFTELFRTSPDGKPANQFYCAMLSTAATQLVIDYFSTSYDPTSWRNQYKAVLGTYKQTKTCKFVGLCCGSWAGNKQFASNNNVLIIDWHYDPLGCGESWTKLWSDPEDFTKRQIFWGKWGACYLAGAELTMDVTFNSDKSILENAGGGFANSYQDCADALPSNKPTPRYKSHCFVPTFSAAALDFNTYAPRNMRNLSLLEQQRGKKMEEYSPFHKIYHQESQNLQHVFGMTPDQISTILSEVRSNTVSLQMVLQMINLM